MKEEKDVFDGIPVIGHIDDPDIGEKLRAAIGAKPGDTITFRTPQFERPKGWPEPGDAPTSVAGFLSLRTMTAEALRKMGLQQWDPILWVYPGEWYDRIPAGLDVVDIFGKVGKFEPGVSDNDIRFGCLPYGFVRDEDVEKFKQRTEEDWW